MAKINLGDKVKDNVSGFTGIAIGRTAWLHGCDVEIDHDHGYEADTNVHCIDWHFVGLSSEEHNALNITDAEEQAIYDRLVEVSRDYGDDL